jgi:hypothetical protein
MESHYNNLNKKLDKLQEENQTRGKKCRGKTKRAKIKIETCY